MLAVASLAFFGGATAALAVPVAFEGASLPPGWSCTGNCGVLDPNGVGTSSPTDGGKYGYVSSAGGVSLGANDLNIGFETNGSLLRSTAFSAVANDNLEFEFQYVTSDGTLSFIEYAWARLLNAADLSPSALLFTARTNPSGTTVPGFGLPPIAATITPATVTISTGATWSPLGGSSGACFGGIGNGCGRTGWAHSDYLIPAAGNYILEFGVVNWGDTAFDSGMAFDRVLVGGKPLGWGDPGMPPCPTVPEPESLPLLALGLVGMAVGLRRRRRA